MTYKEQTEAMAQYELSHDVTGYRVFDWNAWPLLRTMTAYACYRAEALGGAVHRDRPGFSGVARVAGAIRRVPVVGTALAQARRACAIRRAAAAVKALEGIDAAHSEAVAPGGKDVVIFTYSSRRQKTHEGYYEIYSQPLVERLTDMGVATLVWERLEEVSPRTSPSAWISRPLFLEMTRGPALPALPEPPWFREFAEFSGRICGRSFSWVDVAGWIGHVQGASLVFERWLRETGAKMLVNVCWYDGDTMAATLAAHRLGVTAVDLQHGIQDDGHFAYSGWMKVPRHGYEIVPNVFWCWGEGEAQRLMQRNPAFAAHCTTLVGGNLWMERWRTGPLDLRYPRAEELTALAARYRTVVLVALQQHSGHFVDGIAEAMRIAPADWLWLVRLHPAAPEEETRHARETLASGAAQGRVEFDLGGELPLFMLLKLAHLVVAGHSTVSLEALAFGVPSVIVTENGRDACARYLEEGVMTFARGGAELLGALERSRTIAGERCIAASADIFAAGERCVPAIAAFLSELGNRPGAKAHTGGAAVVEPQ